MSPRGELVGSCGEVRANDHSRRIRSGTERMIGAVFELNQQLRPLAVSLPIGATLLS